MSGALSALLNIGSGEKVGTLGHRSEPRSPASFNGAARDSRGSTRRSAARTAPERGSYFLSGCKTGLGFC
jgi:hypothetical protein